VWLGFRLADPIIRLLITVAIFGIMWQSAKAVFTRLLDGGESHVVEDILRAARHVSDGSQVLDMRARWLGHRSASVRSGIKKRAVWGFNPGKQVEHACSQAAFPPWAHRRSLDTRHVDCRERFPGAACRTPFAKTALKSGYLVAAL